MCAPRPRITAMPSFAAASAEKSSKLSGRSGSPAAFRVRSRGRMALKHYHFNLIQCKLNFDPVVMNSKTGVTQGGVGTMGEARGRGSILVYTELLVKIV